MALPTPLINPPPPMAQMTVATTRQIFEDFETHRAVAGDEIMIVERMNEGAVHPIELMSFGSDPASQRSSKARAQCWRRAAHIRSS